MLAMLAQHIDNRGDINATLGQVAFGVGEKITMSFDDAGLISLVIDEGLKKMLVDEDGRLNLQPPAPRQKEKKRRSEARKPPDFAAGQQFVVVMERNIPMTILYEASDFNQEFPELSGPLGRVILLRERNQGVMELVSMSVRDLIREYRAKRLQRPAMLFGTKIAPDAVENSSCNSGRVHLRMSRNGYS